MSGNRKSGHKTLAIILAVIASIVLLGIIIGVVMFKFGHNDEKGAATGASALESFKDIAGESFVETLGDLKEAKKRGEPAKYLAENSVYILDDEAIEIYVESYITAAESTAQATGTTVEKLIVEEWGYESIDAYREEAKQLAHTFIKERLAVYEAAKSRGVKITESEYKEQLSVYAVKFGYATAVEFEYACTPASIANEMLYDKTLNELSAN